jgi:phage anti-repressor protein
MQLFLPSFCSGSSLLTEAELKGTEFPISLYDACAFLNLRRQNIKRIVDPKLTRRLKDSTGFVEGGDFVRVTSKTGKPGSVLQDLLLTQTCFKEVIMQYQARQGKESRRYFAVVEGDYRDDMAEALAERVAQDTPTLRKWKEGVESKENFGAYPKVPSAYAYISKATPRSPTMIYYGITNNPARRFSRHSAKMNGPIHIMHCDPDPQKFPEAEAMCEMRQWQKLRPAVPQGMKGTNSVALYDPRIYKIIHQVCRDEIQQEDEKVQSKLQALGIALNEQPKVLSKIGDYPFKNFERKKNRPTWMDGWIADYRSHPPTVTRAF